MKTDYLIIGAGLSGATLAERFASKLDKKVIIVDSRNHIAGNCFDFYNDAGILIQKYGPHIFHTSSEVVWNYLSNFTEWNNYVHRVIAYVNGSEVYLPISLDTMERLYGYTFTPEELKEYFECRRIKLDKITNSRDVIVSQVGEELYDLFFKNYTKKQWGVYPDELDAQVTKRLPVRFNRDTRYFTDKYQGIPRYGYAKMVEKMLTHENIRIIVNTDYKEVIDEIEFDKAFYTGPIDYFFDYKFGKLPYRSLEFKMETLDVEQYQNAAVVNYPNDYDFTRITEFKQFYFQKHHKTVICREYPKPDGDPYYPVPNDDNQNIYLRYREEACRLDKFVFTGRLAEFSYLNMDEVVLKSINLVDSTCVR